MRDDKEDKNLPLTGEAAVAEMRRRSRRGFLAGGLAAAAAYGGWNWIKHSAPVDGVQKPLRAALNFNAQVSRRVLGESGLAPTFSVDKAVQNVRLNGNIGIDPVLRLDTWKLQVTGLPDAKLHPQYVEDVNTYKPQEDEELMAKDPDADVYGSTGGSLGGEDELPEPEAGLLLTLDHIRALPHVEMVTQLKCIEGWSEIVHWGGARFSDFVAAYQKSAAALPKYVGLQTPNRDYYVGLHRADAFHPQTLLCYEMNGQPLTREHGAPLRLVTPLKYGIKHLKQVGKISFTNDRPADYWAENGYDWDAGH